MKVLVEKKYIDKFIDKIKEKNITINDQKIDKNDYYHFKQYENIVFHFSKIYSTLTWCPDVYSYPCNKCNGKCKYINYKFYIREEKLKRILDH
jgi:hypothetical protein